MSSDLSFNRIFAIVHIGMASIIYHYSLYSYSGPLRRRRGVNFPGTSGFKGPITPDDSRFGGLIM